MVSARGVSEILAGVVCGIYGRGSEMNLISCDECGSVFDSDKVLWPVTIHTEDGTLDDDKVRWDASIMQWRLAKECMNCGGTIMGPVVGP